MRLLKYLISFLLVLIADMPLIGQDGSIHNNLKFKRFSLSVGLSQSSVLCIMQDSKGFLWFGTHDGLNRYDGNDFVIYNYDSQDTTSLSDNWIKTLYEDHEGNLWVGTRHGLNRFGPNSDGFVRYFWQDHKPGTTSNLEITTLVEREKDLLIGTRSGLYKLGKEKGQTGGG